MADKKSKEPVKKSRFAVAQGRAQARANQTKKSGEGGIKGYFSGVKAETKKVVWPTRIELVQYTFTVLFACAFFGLFILGVDSAFLTAINALLNI